MKSKRHLKILEIIAERDIETQEDLAEALKSEGFDVTQATVSRDIKNLKLIKMQGPSGKYKYAVPKTHENNMSDKLTSVLANLTTSVEKIDKSKIGLIICATMNLVKDSTYYQEKLVQVNLFLLMLLIMF